MQKIVLIIVLSLILSLKGYSEKENLFAPEFSTAGFYQLDSSVREALNFNVGWRFFKGDIIDAYKVNYDDKSWSLVNLPDGMEILPLNASGGINYQGPSWYRKQFKFSSDFKNKKIFIHFEGIMGVSKIWINGELVKTHFGGYYPIHVDITKYIKIDKDNLIAVRADNSNNSLYPPGKEQEKLDFTYFGGIYRDAWIIAHNNIYITHPLVADKVAGGGVFYRSEDVSTDYAKLTTLIDLRNEATEQSVDVFVQLKDENGNVVVHHKGSHTLLENSSKSIKIIFELDHPKLWSPDDPNLYNLDIQVFSSNGLKVDALRKRVGIRTVELRGRKGLFLNGKKYPMVLLGANRHQDFAHIGNALPNNLHWRDAVKLRQAGMRVIRSAHYVQDPAFMDACDALGLMIVPTIPGWQFWNDEPIFMERMIDDVRKIIRLERNRPSVLLWEIIPNETHFPNSYAERATKTAKEEYPYTGFYTATDARNHRSDAQHLFDVLYADDTVWNYKEKSVFKREWGDFVDNWVDHNSVSRVAKQWGEIPQIKQAMHYFCEEWIDDNEEKDWPSMTKIFSASSALVGATLWHSFDHQRGYHPDPFWGGIMDAYRQPKFSYFLLKSLLPANQLSQVPLIEDDPFVFIAHLMTPFSPSDVTIFTNCDEVRLSLFGKEIGTKSAISDQSLVPRVPVIFNNVFRYVDARNKNKKNYGMINQKYPETAFMKAEGLINGEVVSEHIRWPVGRKRRLILKVDDSAIQPIADGSDITPVVAYLVDSSGGIKRLSDEYIRFKVSGFGELIEKEDIGINPQKLLWGESVALVRSAKEQGIIRVEAEVICDSLNGPDQAFVEFSTIAPRHVLLYDENITKELMQNYNTPASNNTIDDLKLKLRKTEKELQEYKLMEVGRQQQNFIQ